MRFALCLFALLAFFGKVCEGHSGSSAHHGQVYILVPRKFIVVGAINANTSDHAPAIEPEPAQPCIPMVEAPLPGDDLDDGEDCTSVVDTAEAAGLNTLVAAVNAAGLAEILGPDFVGTVFAPTEKAFANLLTELNVTATELLANTDLLTQVLLIHVVPGVVAFDSDLEDGQEIPTAAEGVSLTVSIRRGKIFIVAPSGVRARVVSPNIQACDAVVHVINKVLTPAG